MHASLHVSSGQNPSRTILKICGECNGKLSEAFEQPASALFKRIIEAESMTLSISDQIVLARWTVKTDMLLLLRRAVLARDAEPAVPAATVASIRADVAKMTSQSGWLPDHCVVRIGRVIPNSFPIRLRNIRPFDITESGHVHSFNTLANVVTESVIFAPHSAAEYAARARIDARMLVLCPNDGSAQNWPPVDSLNTEVHAELLADAVAGPGAGWGMQVDRQSGVPRPTR